MTKGGVAGVQYTEAAMARGIIRLFLNPAVAGTGNLVQLDHLASRHNCSVVIVANHINALDPLYISAVLAQHTGTRFYPVWLPAKKRFFSNPLKSALMRLHGCMPVGVGRDADSLQSMKHVIEKVRTGESICVFPEGRVSLDGKLGEDMGFVTFLARRGSLVVQPVKLSGIGGFKAEWRSILLRQRQLEITFGAPQFVERGSSVDCISLIRDAVHD